MKKVFLTMVVFLIATVTFAQNYQDVVYLKNGSIIRGIIIEQVPNESLKIETADCNLFVYKMVEVEKMTKERIAAQQAPITTFQSAAVNSNPVKEEVKNSPVLSKVELMQRMEMNAPLLYQQYKSGSTLSSVGAGLTLGGVALAIIGVAVADKETTTDGYYTEVTFSGPGAAVLGVGVVSALVGTPLWIVGGSKKRKARNAYFREFGYGENVPVQPSPYLQFNTAPNRLGLAVVF